jgi:hypothetical protein
MFHLVITDIKKVASHSELVCMVRKGTDLKVKWLGDADHTTPSRAEVKGGAIPPHPHVFIP